MSLERLIRDGPPDSDVRGALESARLKVLDQGIRADSDGMVSFFRGIGDTLCFYACEYKYKYEWMLIRWVDRPVVPSP